MMTRRRASGGSSATIRILFGLAIAVFSVISFLSSQQFNEVTGENQHISLSTDQEIALGLQSVPQMVQEFGGLYQDSDIQNLVDEIGIRLVNSSPVSSSAPWRFEFSVLDDLQTINAFALPGGPVFITTAMLGQLETEDEVAGVIAHEIIHVLARHSAQRIAQSQLTNGLIGAVGVASGDASAQQTAAMIGQLVNMRYGREDEIQSDTLGVCLMIAAGYDPNGMLRVMEVLERAGGGGGQPEFFSTHPSPENRIGRIEETIANAESVCERF
jgi:predicted Zn-dependent protease